MFAPSLILGLIIGMAAGIWLAIKLEPANLQLIPDLWEEIDNYDTY